MNLPTNWHRRGNVELEQSTGTQKTWIQVLLVHFDMIFTPQDALNNYFVLHKTESWCKAPMRLRLCEVWRNTHGKIIIPIVLRVPAWETKLCSSPRIHSFIHFLLNFDSRNIFPWVPKDLSGKEHVLKEERFEDWKALWVSGYEYKPKLDLEPNLDFLAPIKLCNFSKWLR